MKSETGQLTPGMQAQTGKHAGAREGGSSIVAARVSIAHVVLLLLARHQVTCAAAVILQVSMVVDQPWRLAPTAASVCALADVAIHSNMVYFRLPRTIGTMCSTNNSYMPAAPNVALAPVAP